MIRVHHKYMPILECSLEYLDKTNEEDVQTNAQSLKRLTS